MPSERGATLPTYDFNALMAASEKKSRVRKALKLVLFRAPFDADVADLATGYLDPTDRTKINLELMTIWTPYGILSRDGISGETNVNVEPTEGYNYGEPVREDFTSAERELSFTLIEDFTRIALETQTGMDLSGVVPDEFGGIAFDESSIPAPPFYRILGLSQDFFMGQAAKPIYEVNLWPSTRQKSLPNFSRSQGSEQSTEVTYTVYTDENLGTPRRRWIGGTGYDASSHGFTTAPTAP